MNTYPIFSVRIGYISEPYPWRIRIRYVLDTRYGPLLKYPRIVDHGFEEYEEEILMQEKVPEPPLTDSADTVPVQGKPGAYPLFFIITEYICDVHLRYRNLIKITCIDISLI